MSDQRTLVTDGEARSVVGACRGLAAAGFRVDCVACTKLAPAHWSRSVDERFVLPHPHHDRAGFVDGVGRIAAGRIAAGLSYAGVIPGTDATLQALSLARDGIEPHVRLGLPPHSVVAACLNKLSVSQAAAAVGFAVPENAVCPTLDDGRAAADRFGFPVILKPVSSLVDVGGVPDRVGSVRIEDAECLAQMSPAYGSPFLIERIETGRIVSFAGVLADGRLFASAVSRYIRTWYPEAGNVCFSETIEPQGELTERVVALLHRLGWEGIFELELIERPDGSFLALDFNPRVYGSVALAVAAGANLPAIWAEWLRGGRPDRVSAQPGRHYRWEDADLRHALRIAREGHPTKAAAMMIPRRGTAHAYMARHDPGPFAARTIELTGLVRKRVRGKPCADGEVAVIGAGPYGLAAAAHLRHAGASLRVFGEPLEFWRTQMPTGMLLRSRRRSTHISDPLKRLTIDDYEADTGREVRSPSLRLDEFIDYGLWFQRRAVPDIDRRKVRRVERRNGGFRLELEDGDQFTAARVIVAAGLFPFGRRPEPFRSLPDTLVSHSAQVKDPAQFAERKVLVVGGGQSALESAALLHEAGAQVEVVARAPQIWWLDPEDSPKQTLRSRLPRPPTDVGGFASGWTAGVPDLWRLTPRRLRPTVSFRCIRPAGSDWLRPRLEQVPLSEGAIAVSAQQSYGQVSVTLADGSERTVDHVLLGTGYEIDVRRYPFIAPELASQIDVESGYPSLGPGLESSVPGLHFVGAPAARSFGPIMRFVVGTWYAAPSVTQRVMGHRQRPMMPAFLRR